MMEELRPNSVRFWSAPAERSDDGAFYSVPEGSAECISTPGCESGVALRFPPHSKTQARFGPSQYSAGFDIL